MKSPVLITCLLTCLLFAGSVIAQSSGVLSTEDQQRIVQDYLYVMGRSPQPSAAAATADLPSLKTPLKCGTSAVAELVMNRDRLDPRVRAALGVDSLRNRPQGLSQSYVTPSGHFKIHYAVTGDSAVLSPSGDANSNGVPDYVDMMAAIADSIYQREVTGLGYAPPPSDGFYPQGDGNQFDIYVINLAPSFFGLTYIDSLYLDTDSMTATSFMVLDNDYGEIPGYESRPYDAMRVTIAHEFFHAIQFGIDITEAEYSGTTVARRYWMEMSATWMEEEMYTSINDYYSYLPYFFQVPGRSIQQFSTSTDLHPYGSVVYPLYLSQKYGAGIIKSIWDRCASLGRGPSFLVAADEAIDSASNHTQNWVKAFAEFSMWNYFTGARAAHAPNGIGYAERANYPIVPDSTEIYSGGGTAWQRTVAIRRTYPFLTTANQNDVLPDHNAMALVRFERVGLTKTSATDSTFDVGGAVDTLAPVWGLKIIYEYLPNSDLGIASDSFLVESYYLVKPPSTTTLLFEFGAQSVYPDRFKSITYLLTPATIDETRYVVRSPSTHPMLFAYYSDDTLAVDTNLVNRPAAVLTPYPNPAVVSQMGGRRLRFRFEVPLDTTNAPISPRVVVDLFNEAGEYVATVDQITTIVDKTGKYETEWDMKNAKGKDVASGVYIGVARLYAGSDTDQTMAEAKVKVLVVR